MENKTPEFMKNETVVFHLNSSDDEHHYWFNKFKDSIEEDRETGKCNLIYHVNDKSNKRVKVIKDIKNFDTALDLLNSVKYPAE
tara:strand:+ start:453 stop:704 length:252 start_codon:yes stop_codon:yes gene_type:complete